MRSDQRDQEERGRVYARLELGLVSRCGILTWAYDTAGTLYYIVHKYKYVGIQNYKLLLLTYLPYSVLSLGIFVPPKKEREYSTPLSSPPLPSPVSSGSTAAAAAAAAAQQPTNQPNNMYVSMHDRCRVV